MLIDWFTVIAQIFNFVVLLLLLRRFLYRPILGAMQERERKVAERLESAAQERIRAEEERERYQALTDELHRRQSEKQSQAEEEVEAWRKQALHEARQEVEVSSQAWRKSLEQEKDVFTTDLRQFAVRQSYAVAEKALRDLADNSLEERLLTQFTSRLEQGEIDLEKFKVTDELTVRSAFELPGDSRKRIADILQKNLGKVSLKYEVTPALGAGIELESAAGYQVAWNLNRYLQVLEEDLTGQLQQNKAD